MAKSVKKINNFSNSKKKLKKELKTPKTKKHLIKSNKKLLKKTNKKNLSCENVKKKKKQSIKIQRGGKEFIFSFPYPNNGSGVLYSFKYDDSTKENKKESIANSIVSAFESNTTIGKFLFSSIFINYLKDMIQRAINASKINKKAGNNGNDGNGNNNNGSNNKKIKDYILSFLDDNIAYIRSIGHTKYGLKYMLPLVDAFKTPRAIFIDIDNLLTQFAMGLLTNGNVYGSDTIQSFKDYKMYSRAIQLPIQGEQSATESFSKLFFGHSMLVLKALLDFFARQENNNTLIYFTSLKYTKKQLKIALLISMETEQDFLMPLLRGEKINRNIQPTLLELKRVGATGERDIEYKFLDEYFFDKADFDKFVDESLYLNNTKKSGGNYSYLDFIINSINRKIEERTQIEERARPSSPQDTYVFISPLPGNAKDYMYMINNQTGFTLFHGPLTAFTNNNAARLVVTRESPPTSSLSLSSQNNTLRDRSDYIIDSETTDEKLETLGLSGEKKADIRLLVNAFDIYLFDFDNTLTRGGIHTRSFPENLTVTGQRMILSAGYCDDILTSLDENSPGSIQDLQSSQIGLFVSLMFGFERGRFFVRLFDYLHRNSKKLAIVTFGESDVIFRCLQILFEYMNKELSLTTPSSTPFVNPFYNPYENNEELDYKMGTYYSRFMGIDSTKMENINFTLYEKSLQYNPKVFGLGHLEKDDLERLHVYKSGVILSTNPSGIKISKTGGKFDYIENNQEKYDEYKPVYSNEMRTFGKNKMIRRLVMDLSGLTLELSLPTDKLTLKKKKTFFETIFFDDDHDNIDKLSRPYNADTHFQDQGLLQYVSGIKIGKLEKTDNGDFDMSLLNTTLSKISKDGKIYYQDGGGLSIATFLAIQKYLQALQPPPSINYVEPQPKIKNDVVINSRTVVLTQPGDDDDSTSMHESDESVSVVNAVSNSASTVFVNVSDNEHVSDNEQVSDNSGFNASSTRSSGSNSGKPTNPLLIYQAFQKEFTELELKQKEFEFIKYHDGVFAPSGCPFKVHLVDAYDVFLFEFDKVITRGCVDTLNYPNENGTDTHKLTADEITNMSSDLAKQRKFVETLFGLERGLFFAKFVRYLHEKGKKIAIVTYSDSAIIYACLEALIDCLNKLHKKTKGSKDAYINPFYNPYKNHAKSVEYAKNMGNTSLSSYLIEDKDASMEVDKQEKQGNKIIYENGVILSLNPAGRTKKNGKELSIDDLRQHNFVSDRVKREDGKNKMIRRLVMDLSGMTEVSTDNMSSEDMKTYDSIKRTWFLRTIFFDVDKEHVDKLKTPEDKNDRLPKITDIYLNSVSAIQLGNITLSEGSTQINQRELNNTLTSYSTKTTSQTYCVNGFGLSLSTILKIQEYLTETYLNPRRKKPVVYLPYSFNNLTLASEFAKFELDKKIVGMVDSNQQRGHLSDVSSNPLVPSNILFQKPRQTTYLSLADMVKGASTLYAVPV